MPQPAPKRPRGRPRLEPEAQRQRLFDALIRAIEKHGYESTRVADIVGEAGMSSRSFYQLFDSKDDLVAEYVQRAAAGLVSTLRTVWIDSSNPLERIDHGVEAFLEILPGIPVDLDEIGGEAGRRTREARKAAVREVSRLVVVDLQRAYQDGRLTAPPDPMTVELVMTGLETMILRYFAEGRRSELAQLRQRFTRLLERAGLSPSR